MIDLPNFFWSVEITEPGLLDSEIEYISFNIYSTSYGRGSKVWGPLRIADFVWFWSFTVMLMPVFSASLTHPQQAIEAEASTPADASLDA